jgi:hypothetical protein
MPRCGLTGRGPWVVRVDCVAVGEGVVTGVIRTSGAVVPSHTRLTNVSDGAGMGGPVLDSHRTSPAGTD